MSASRRSFLKLIATAFMIGSSPGGDSQGFPRQRGGHKPESFYDLVRAARQSNKKSVVIPEGVYFVTAQDRQFHFELSNMSDFEINARGVTLLLADPAKGGICFSDCRNVALRGATVKYATSPSTQGVVEAIAPDGNSYDIRIDHGYPTNLDDPRYFREEPIGYLFDPQTRWWKVGTYDLYVKDKPLRLSSNSFRVTWKQALGPAVHPVAIGDLIAFRGSGRPLILINNSMNMHMDNVTILNAAGMAVVETNGEGGNRYSVTVKRGPRSPGASTDPLLSSTADGFHSAAVRKGPIVENSYFEAMTDDGIAIHGHFSLVLKAAGSRIIINEYDFRAGDTLKLYDPDGKPAGEATVKSITPMQDFHNQKISKRETRKDLTQGPYVELLLDRPLAADFDYQVENPAAVGAGFIVRNNVIKNHRARGMVIKSHDGLVTGNLIDGSTISAILMAPEFWWNESGYASNIVVRDNIFRNVAYAPRSLGGVVLTALSAEANPGTAGHHPIDGYGNRNITFENNHFEDINGVNLLVTSASDVMIRNNKFTNAQKIPVQATGASWGEDPHSIIFISNAEGVKLANNEVMKPGKENRSLITVMSSPRVEGIDTGIRLKR